MVTQHLQKLTVFEESEQQAGAGAGACEKSENPQAIDEKITNNTKPTVTITDVDVFDCPICFENLRIPVHQCKNGHIACGSCRQKVNQKCPTCLLTIECRCLAIEKVLEAAQFSCGNLIYGCKYIMKYSEKPQHEHVCVYTGCSCPIHDCHFVHSASNLYQHIGKEHKAKNFDFNCCFFVHIKRNTRFRFFRERTSGTVFVLNQFSVHERSAVSVVLIAPKSSTGKYRYELEVEDTEASLSLESAVASVTKLVDYSPTKYLLVVEDFLDPFGHVMLQIRIRLAEEAKGNSTKK